MLLIFFLFSETETSSESSSPSDVRQEEAAQGENMTFGVKLGFRAIHSLTGWMFMGLYLTSVNDFSFLI